MFRIYIDRSVYLYIYIVSRSIQSISIYFMYIHSSLIIYTQKFVCLHYHYTLIIIHMIRISIYDQ